MPVNPLSTIDMLSPKITLYYKQKNKHNSPISGVLTIIAFGFILSFVFIFFLRYIKRENPIAYFLTDTSKMSAFFLLTIPTSFTMCNY